MESVSSGCLKSATGVHRMRFNHGFKIICAAVTLAFITGTHTRSQAEESILITIGPRIGFSTSSTPLLGKQQKENLRL